MVNATQGQSPVRLNAPRRTSRTEWSNGGTPHHIGAARVVRVTDCEGERIVAEAYWYNAPAQTVDRAAEVVGSVDAGRAWLRERGFEA